MKKELRKYGLKLLFEDYTEGYYTINSCDPNIKYVEVTQNVRYALVSFEKEHMLKNFERIKDKCNKNGAKIIQGWLVTDINNSSERRVHFLNR